MYRIQKWDNRTGWTATQGTNPQPFLSFEGAEDELKAKGWKTARYRIVMDPVEYRYENPSVGEWKRG